MIIDIIFILLVVFAIFKGIKRGLILALFSLIGLIVGLAAAMKLSVVVAGYIGKAVSISEKWLPVIAFVVVFIIVVLLIRWCALLLQKSIEFAMLGWLNKLGGILLYAALYILIFSVLIFYADKLGMLKPETKTVSVTYSYIQPMGPKVMEGLGKIIPIFRDMFNDLENFFDNVSNQVPPAG